MNRSKEWIKIKREAGAVRNAAWRTLSRDQQIASLRARRGYSMKQLKRLGVDVE